MSDTLKFVYAPFIRLYFRPAGDTRASYVKTGVLEENSEIKFTPVYAEKGPVKRLLGINIQILCYDIEATAETQLTFLPYINTEVDCSADCDSGIAFFEKLEYNFYPEHAPKRGMRWVHALNGFMHMPKWVTFFDSVDPARTTLTWDAFRKIALGQTGLASGTTTGGS